MNRRFELTNQEWERLGHWGRCCPLVSCPCREQAPDAFRAELERIGIEGAVDCSRLTISDQLLRRLLATAPQKDDRPPEFGLALELAPLNLASCSKRASLKSASTKKMVLLKPARRMICTGMASAASAPEWTRASAWWCRWSPAGVGSGNHG